MIRLLMVQLDCELTNKTLLELIIIVMCDVEYNWIYIQYNVKVPIGYIHKTFQVVKNNR